jgi:thiosulfate reductase cytochrome b subunit
MWYCCSPTDTSLLLLLLLLLLLPSGGTSCKAAERMYHSVLCWLMLVLMLMLVLALVSGLFRSGIAGVLPIDQWR